MLKFQRNYKMQVQVDDQGTLVDISYPMTLEFSIRRGNLSSAGTASFRVYNLNRKNRDQIYKGPTDVDVMRTIKLDAGYGNQLSTIFNGNISEAKSGRSEGQVNFITEIEAFDYAFAMANSTSNWTVQGADATKDKVIRRLAADLKYPLNGTETSVPVGSISTFEGSYPRGYTASGNTWEALKTVTEDQCTVDLGKIYIIKKNDAFIGPIPVIDSDSGLLGTPKRNQNWITFEMLFEPRLLVGQVVRLDSRTQAKFNGIHKVIGIEHSGVISGAVGGKCKTKVTLMIGDNDTTNPFNMVQAT